MKSKRIKNMVYISLGAVLLSVCSFIAIPFVFPFTLQTFGLFMVLLLLGGRKGSLSVLLYIALGIIGLPVFSGFGGGIGYLLGATGGFIMGFLVGSLVYWLCEIICRKVIPYRVLGMLLCLVICYVCGTVWYLSYSANSAMGIVSALSICVFPYIIPDLFKMLLALLIWKRIRTLIKI